MYDHSVVQFNHTARLSTLTSGNCSGMSPARHMHRSIRVGQPASQYQAEKGKKGRETKRERERVGEM
jgi:hypothetical protein